MSEWQLALGPNAVLRFLDHESLAQRLPATHRQVRDGTPDAAGTGSGDGSTTAAAALSLSALFWIDSDGAPDRRRQRELAGRVYFEIEGLGRQFARLVDDGSQCSGDALQAELLRFAFSAQQVAWISAGAEFGFGIDDDRMRVGGKVTRTLRAALLGQLAGA